MDNYTTPAANTYQWAGMTIVNWHRPLAAYFEALLEAGWLLERFLEPLPSDEAIAAHPHLDDERRIPWFWAARWRKPG